MVRRGKALCAAALLSLCVTLGHAAEGFAIGDLASDEARYAMRWVLDSADHQSQPFAIVDKKQARIHVFDSAGQLLGSSPVLIGLAQGDLSVADIANRTPASLRNFERTTPAGRFETRPGHNDKGEPIVWFDYDASLAIHRLRPAPAAERRAERMVSPDPAEHRISLGCVVVPVDFYERVIATSLGKSRGVVYVLPQVRDARAMFGAFRSARAD